MSTQQVISGAEFDYYKKKFDEIREAIFAIESKILYSPGTTWEDVKAVFQDIEVEHFDEIERAVRSNQDWAYVQENYPGYIGTREEWDEMWRVGEARMAEEMGVILVNENIPAHSGVLDSQAIVLLQPDTEL